MCVDVNIFGMSWAVEVFRIEIERHSSLRALRLGEPPIWTWRMFENTPVCLLTAVSACRTNCCKVERDAPRNVPGARLCVGS
uniref:Uncharacterized protein n=1 Tax=Anguilla anguilla TaxID=7936 RepID=A0A0E9PMU1_ANGAN